MPKIFIKNLTKREKYTAFATFAIAIIALIYSFIIEPVSKRWRFFNSEIRSKTRTLERDLKIMANSKAIESDYAKFSKYVKIAKSEEETIADILAYIENVSRNNSCFIINIKPAGTKSLGSHKELLIDLTAEANMAQFSKFLYDIENSKDMLLRVKRFNISSKYNQTGILKGTFLISKILIE